MSLKAMIARPCVRERAPDSNNNCLEAGPSRSLSAGSSRSSVAMTNSWRNMRAKNNPRKVDAVWLPSGLQSERRKRGAELHRRSSTIPAAAHPLQRTTAGHIFQPREWAWGAAPVRKFLSVGVLPVQRDTKWSIC